MRKIISLALGLILTLGGAFGFVYMLLYSGPVKLVVWVMPITLFAFGCALLWEDITSYLKDRS